MFFISTETVWFTMTRDCSTWTNCKFEITYTQNIRKNPQETTEMRVGKTSWCYIMVINATAHAYVFVTLTKHEADVGPNPCAHPIWHQYTSIWFWRRNPHWKMLLPISRGGRRELAEGALHGPKGNFLASVWSAKETLEFSTSIMEGSTKGNKSECTVSMTAAIFLKSPIHFFYRPVMIIYFHFWSFWLYNKMHYNLLSPYIKILSSF